MIAFPAPPTIVRQRHELRRRTLTVAGAERLTPSMIRIVLSGDELEGFHSGAPDDHIKLFIPGPGGEPQMRDYTPRHFDPRRRELVVDFAIHDAGPATAWALAARPGDTVQIGGPRGSRVVEGEVPHWLLIGDETALPAIGRRIEEAGADARITLLAAVPGPQDEQRFSTEARVDARWVHRPADAAAEPAPLLDRLRVLPIDPGTFVWIAAEAGVTRVLRAHLLDERDHPRGWLQASGYWVLGQADATEKFD